MQRWSGRSRTAADRVRSAQELGADGTGYEFIHIPSGGAKHPHHHPDYQKDNHFIRVRGREVYRFAVQMSELIRKASEMVGDEEIKVVIPHQVNLRIIEAARERLDWSMDRFFVNIDKYGNTSAGSVPIALDEAVREGALKKGDLVVLVAFGAGLTGARPCFAGEPERRVEGRQSAVEHTRSSAGAGAQKEAWAELGRRRARSGTGGRGLGFSLEGLLESGDEVTGRTSRSRGSSRRGGHLRLESRGSPWSPRPGPPDSPSASTPRTGRPGPSASPTASGSCAWARPCRPSEQNPSGMVALAGANIEQAEALARSVPSTACRVANLNAPGQVVLSGAHEALEAVRPRRGSRGAPGAPARRRWRHSECMRPAADRLVQRSRRHRRGSAVPVISNVTAAP